MKIRIEKTELDIRITATDGKDTLRMSLTPEDVASLVMLLQMAMKSDKMIFNLELQCWQGRSCWTCFAEPAVALSGITAPASMWSAWTEGRNRDSPSTSSKRTRFGFLTGYLARGVFAPLWTAGIGSTISRRFTPARRARATAGCGIFILAGVTR